MLDYLLRNDWVVYNPAGPALISPQSQNPRNISVVFWGRYDQQLAFLAAGRRIAPARFGAAYARHAPLAELAWVSAWTETFEPIGSYYKFNLDHINYNTWLRNEQNPGRWRQARSAFAILRDALGHHQNAHFNLCELTADPPRRHPGSFFPGGFGNWRDFWLASQSRDELELWLGRPARHLAVTNSTDPSIEKVTYTASLASFGTSLLPDEEKRKIPVGVQVAKYPVPVARRVTSDFIWQRNPFQLDGGGDDRKESPGLDLILPYWMARYVGAFR
jgi:hypothetical protein